MTMFDFLAITGALAWLYIAWRSYQYVRGATARIRWALWGYRKRHKQATNRLANGPLARVSQASWARETVNHRPLS